MALYVINAIEGETMRRSASQGLTLLEVMIALVIVTIALTAIIKATTENIRATAYLHEKTTATWVGLNILNKARLGLIQLPPAPAHQQGQETTLNHDWQWQGFTQSTANARIRELHVQVFYRPTQPAITELMSYIYAA